MERGQASVWKHDRQRIWQSAPAGPGRTTVPAQIYSFDRVFGPDESTAQIHEECVRERVTRLLAGYNATIFAYGQTSSGKTTTIRGDAAREGLIPLCVRQVLNAAAAANERTPEGHAWSVKMSYLEIYNETIGDLLSGQTNLQIYEKKGGGLHVQDLSEEAVTDWKRAEALLLAGDENKHVGCTLHNDKSSRAHTVFRLQVDISRPEGEVIWRPGEEAAAKELAAEAEAEAEEVARGAPMGCTADSPLARRHARTAMSTLSVATRTQHRKRASLACQRVRTAALSGAPRLGRPRPAPRPTPTEAGPATPRRSERAPTHAASRRNPSI